MREDRGTVLKKIYVKGEVQLSSPCMVGSGNDDTTDMDVIKDHHGQPFIPGASLAGVFRSYINSKERSGQEDSGISSLFGDRIENSDDVNTMSCIYISDGIFKTETPIIRETRDGVMLNQWKTVCDSSKYDYEVVSAGARFVLKLEIVIRKRHEEKIQLIEEFICQIIEGLKDEEISVGAKTRRGFGRMRLLDSSLKIMVLDFQKDNPEDVLNRWLEFEWDDFVGNISYEDFKSGYDCKKNKFVTLEAGFKINTSIMIRSYSRSIDKADFEHLKNGVGEPIIPGTSWTGAIRSHAGLCLAELGKDTRWLDRIFGYVCEREKTAYASLVTIEESEIKNSRCLQQTRVKIDRFSGGAVRRALYTEKPEYLGEVVLKIRILKRFDYKKQEIEALIGLLILVLKDLSNGILPVGGETSIGRGIMKVSKGLSIKGMPDIKEVGEDYYLKALATFDWEGEPYAKLQIED